MSDFENDLHNLSPAVRRQLDRLPAQFIANEWRSSQQTLDVFEPSTDTRIAYIARGTDQDVNAAVQAASDALRHGAWRGRGPQGRERLMLKLAELIERDAELISQLESLDNGMQLWFARISVQAAADVYRYFAGWPTKLSGETTSFPGPPDGATHHGFVLREPVGVIAAIVPWNVPFMMAAWKLAPALAAGCTVVLKPAEDTSLSARVLADLILEAGFPPGVVNIVSGLGAQAGEALVRHPLIDKISFTGSTATGRRIACHAAENLKKTTLELGGKSPTIIFDDADVEAAAKGAADAIFLNSGQICVAGSRVYVHETIHAAVVERLRTHAATLPVGPGLRDGNFIGPLVSRKQQARVAGFIRRAQERGLDVHGSRSFDQARGYYVAPTVIEGARAEDEITQEEVFGPVVSVYSFRTTDEAIEAANGTAYGLAATVWSRNIDRILAVSTALQCGKVSVNTSGFPYPGLPEGGYKASGYGRDLGRAAVEQCLDTKSVVIRAAG